ncbi:hypothetical protein CHLNCDRAFT_137003 [Chlorella variabilis]|uniref:Coatomer subunit zeta n=1 Tax=Chlorella variabilis TaxID=554065 RepID=E1ZLS5_CHLVA|nr:hypothetical protein CHLNCDRAFT_137003 [Chlorella variabilis]EFN53185.1 hypothetical protein CHLNCDRAFT_137003 [Chlorella variabilis]|eukprot:XP_005845287.1 hypothetical protein CHLNCDRAFT_137003 [Chlorella variabilis]
MSCGRINALAITTRQGQVVYERFYDQFSEGEKAEIRGAFDGVAGPSSAAAAARSTADDVELVGRFRNGRIVCIPSGELLLFALGTGEYNELALAEVLRTIIAVYREVFKAAALTDALLFSNYALAALVVDEVCREGLVELTDRLSIQKAIAMRLPYEPPAEKSGKSTFSRLRSSKAAPASG